MVAPPPPPPPHKYFLLELFNLQLFQKKSRSTVSCYGRTTHLCHITQICENENFHQMSHFFVVVITNKGCHDMTTSFFVISNYAALCK